MKEGEQNLSLGNSAPATSAPTTYPATTDGSPRRKKGHQRFGVPRVKAARIGYARVSTDEQSLDLQLDALRKAGCEKVFEDHGISGSVFCRPGLDRALASLQPGDSLIVWRLDRLGRSLKELVNLVEDLGSRCIEFESLTEAISTHSAGGTLLFHLMAALSQFERSLISERTRAGMAAAKARGKRLGRRPLLTDEQVNVARHLLLNASTATVAKQLDVHPRTLKRLVCRGN